MIEPKSPSCGLGTAPVLNQTGKLLCYDNGIAAQMLLKAYPKIDISDERHFE